MVERLTAEQVIALPLNKKEELHRSRRRQGHHVYFSRAMQEMNNMSAEEAHMKFADIMGCNAGDSDDSIDSNSSLYYERMYDPPRHKYKLRCVWKMWRDMSEERKNGWKVRATNLNQRFLPGKVNAIPSKPCFF